MSNENLNFGNTKTEVIKTIQTKNLCMKHMFQSKDKIADRLKIIAIALPSYLLPYTNSFSRFEGYGPDVTSSIDAYYLSIQTRKDTGIVKKIQIYSQQKKLRPEFEQKLYQFLLLVKIPFISFCVTVETKALNEFLAKAAFVENLHLIQQISPEIKIPGSIKTSNAELRECQA